MRQLAALGLALALSLALGEPELHAQGREDERRPASARTPAAIAGRVLNAGSETPVRGADVVAVSNRGMRVPTKTDDNGAYRLEGLTQGEWRVTASKAGYVEWQFGQRRPFEVPPPVLLARAEEFTADIAMTRGGAITGRVFDQQSEPLAGLQVRVYRARMQRGARRLTPVGAADLTDDTGSYRVYGLPPGDYYVAASLRMAPADSVVETTYSPTYFPGTGDLAGAQRIRLELGGEANATFPLLPFTRARVSGVVITSGGTPANAFLSLVSDASEFGQPLGDGGVTTSDGTFTLADVPPGRYLLTATIRGDGPNESGTIPVDVQGDDVSGATIVTGSPASLRGTIVADAGASRRLPSQIEVDAMSVREVGMVLGGDSGASFEISNLSEPFRLSVGNLPDGWMVKSITVNDVDALDNPVELQPGSQGEARIVLTDQVTEVSGVAAPSDTSTPGAVVVFLDDATKWGPYSRYLRVAEPDATGAFRIVGLPPGENYRAIATSYLEDGEHTDPEFLNGIRDAAVVFPLVEGERRSLELTTVER